MSVLPQAKPPTDSPELPLSVLPSGSCDAHIHLLGTDPVFPLWDKRIEDPAEGFLEDWIARLVRQMGSFGFSRTVVVHSILYGADNSLTLAAVKALGPSVARGIGLVTDDATEADLDNLAKAGIVGVRLNYVHGGVLTWEGARRLAPALAARDMHIQMLMHSHLHVAELAPDLMRIECPVVFDHFGWPDLSLGHEDPGFDLMCRLAGEGLAYIKLSGSYRVCDAPYDRAAPFLRKLLETAPERMLWGTDWPHIMLGNANQPDAGVLLNQFLDIAGDDGTIRQVLVENPIHLYGFS